MKNKLKKPWKTMKLNGFYVKNNVQKLIFFNKKHDDDSKF